jgi:hypothetical protein
MLDGYWISPDNLVFTLKVGENHIVWIDENRDELKKYFDFDDDIDAGHLFSAACEKGFVRLRQQLDMDTAQNVCSMTGCGVKRLSEMPEFIFNIMSNCDLINFLDIYSDTEIDITKEEMPEYGIIPKDKTMTASIRRKASIGNAKTELDFLEAQCRKDEYELLKFYFILNHISLKSDIDKVLQFLVDDKLKSLKENIDFDKYNQYEFESIQKFTSHEVDFILAKLLNSYSDAKS